jgi:prefoldin subunit 5
MSNDELNELYINALHELNHEKIRREAFEKDVEMHKKMTNLMADRAAGVIVERDRLQAEVDNLRKIAEINPLQSTQENARLKAEVERLTKENALSTPRHLISSQEIKSLQAEVTDLKSTADQFEAEVERLEIMKERFNDARKVIDDLHAITKTSNADKLVEFVQGAADTIGAQAVELDDLRARLRT